MRCLGLLIVLLLALGWSLTLVACGVRPTVLARVLCRRCTPWGAISASL
jgi:hypothetical protein